MAAINRGRDTTLSPEGRALLEWFTAIVKPGQKLGIEDLADGHSIWTVLQQIRPETFTGNLPEEEGRGAGNWLANWQNLKYIYKYLTSYITSEAGRLPRNLDGLDLQAIAKDEGTADAVKVRLSFMSDEGNNNCTLQLLKMVLFAAVNADDNAPYINPMAMLPADQQLLVQQVIMEVSSWNTESRTNSEYFKLQDIADVDDTNNETKPRLSGDKDLYWEEQLATMARDNEKLVREKKDLLASLREQSDRNTRLTNNNSSLQDKLSSLQEKLEQSSGSSVGGSFLKEIESKMKEQEDHIAYQETQLIDLQSNNEELQRDAVKYHELQEKFQPLQDSYDELKAERDSLTRKANAMDKYKAKLQTLADLEKENESLRSAMDELREVNKDGNQAMDQAKAYQRQIDEMSRMIPTIEQELFESKMMKQQIDDHARQLRKQLEDANSRYEQDQNTIRDLMDQLQSSSPRPQGTDSLDSELDQDKQPPKLEKSLVAHHILEVSRLSMLNSHIEHEEINKKLREALTDSDVRYKALESMLDAAKLRNKKLEGIIEEGYASKNDTEQFKGSPFTIPCPTALTDLELRNQQRQDLEKLELQHERSVFSSDDGDSGPLLHELLSKYAYEEKVALVDKHELQRMRNFEAQAEEDESLRARNNDLQAQVLEYQKLLRHQDAHSDAAKDANKIQKEQLSAHEAEIADLKKQLEASKPALLKASEQLQLKQQLEYVKRENKLVTSAFYDLSSRLQLNNVSLQRRSEAPRSFLNKQRLLVSQATAVRMPR